MHAPYPCPTQPLRRLPPRAAVAFTIWQPMQQAFRWHEAGHAAQAGGRESVLACVRCCQQPPGIAEPPSRAGRSCLQLLAAGLKLARLQLLIAQDCRPGVQRVAAEHWPSAASLKRQGCPPHAQPPPQHAAPGRRFSSPAHCLPPRSRAAAGGQPPCTPPRLQEQKRAKACAQQGVPCRVQASREELAGAAMQAAAELSRAPRTRRQLATPPAAGVRASSLPPGRAHPAPPPPAPPPHPGVAPRAGGAGAAGARGRACCGGREVRDRLRARPWQAGSKGDAMHSNLWRGSMQGGRPHRSAAGDGGWCSKGSGGISRAREAAHRIAQHSARVQRQQLRLTVLRLVVLLL